MHTHYHNSFGTRLRPLTLTLPKPLVEFCNKVSSECDAMRRDDGARLARVAAMYRQNNSADCIYFLSSYYALCVHRSLQSCCNVARSLTHHFRTFARTPSRNTYHRNLQHIMLLTAHDPASNRSSCQGVLNHISLSFLCSSAPAMPLGCASLSSSLARVFWRVNPSKGSTAGSQASKQ